MSFWNLSDNTVAQPVTEFAQEGGTMEPLPDGTTVTAYIDEAKWQTLYQSDKELISLRWRVMAPQSAANRVIFQKLDVYGNDDRKKDPQKAADNAKRMLAAIDGNAGGFLSKLQAAPTDADLQANLLNKAMNIRLGLWEFTKDDGSKSSGNWVQAVSPRGNVPEVASKPSQQPAAQAQGSVVTSDSIPF